MRQLVNDWNGGNGKRKKREQTAAQHAGELYKSFFFFIYTTTFINFAINKTCMYLSWHEMIAWTLFINVDQYIIVASDALINYQCVEFNSAWGAWACFFWVLFVHSQDFKQIHKMFYTSDDEMYKVVCDCLMCVIIDQWRIVLLVLSGVLYLICSIYLCQ